MASRNKYNQFDLDEQLEDLDNQQNLPRVRNVPQKRKIQQNKKTQPAPLVPNDAAFAVQIDNRSALDFTYKASRSEAEWLLDSLGGFFEQQWFSDVLRAIKGGKEASVYQCAGASSSNTDYVAAKVYRPRKFRNLKNDFAYREGRDTLDADGIRIQDHRMGRAMEKRTQFGKQLLHTSWIEHEYNTLQMLYEAGLKIPKPYTRGNNAIIMEYIGDDLLGAPTLHEVSLTASEAQRLFDDVLDNVAGMLSLDRIHGDLSAFNILYWEGEITLIDFPQAVSPVLNRNAYNIFLRDLTRVSEYFIRQGLSIQPAHIAADMWTAYGHRLSPQADPRVLDDDNPTDRAYWEKYR